VTNNRYYNKEVLQCRDSYSVDEFDLLYKDGIHRNTDKKLREKLDQIVDEILEEDRLKLRAIEKAKRKNERYIKKYNLA
jgi:hypothetical protein